MLAARARLRSYFDAPRLVFVAAVVLFGVARLLPFAHAHVGVGLDSFDYLDLAKRKSLLATFAAERPPTYLFFIKALGRNRQLVTWGQFTVAVVAWALLAGAISRTLRTRSGQVLGVTIVLLLGSCLDMVQWDRLIGTESLSLSLGVLIVASALWFRQRVNPARAAVLCAALCAWGALRDANAIVVGVAGLGIAAWVIARRPAAWRGFAAVAIICVATWGGSLLSADVGARWEQPVQNIVTFRVLPSPERESYFLRRGLPLTATQASDLAGHCANPAGVFLCRKVTDPAFYQWIDHHARSVYLRSWFAFPATTVWEPIAHTQEMIGTRLPVAYITFTGLNASYARSVEAVVFPRSPRVLLGWLLGLLIALAITCRRKGWPAAATLPAALLLLTYVHLWAVWSGDAVELARHGLGASLQLRLGLWMLSLVLLDAFLSARRREQFEGDVVGVTE